MTSGRSTLAPAVRAGLAALLGDQARFDEPLARHISIGVGGPADALCTVRDLATLRRLLDLLAQGGTARLMLGRGTNLVPSDLGFRGAAIRLDGDFTNVAVDGTGVEAGAGAALAVLVERGLVRDLGGLEFTTGIPGCVGGSLPGNAGTAHEALGDRVERVDVVAEGGVARSYGPAELGFGYRTSALRTLGGVITGARFRLTPRPRAEIVAAVRTFSDKRRDQPLTQPNVGCIFKNPPGESAGRLIDAAGLKGERAGALEVSAKHANFMVNLGGATAEAVLELVTRVRARVLAASGFSLETEVIVLDELGRPVRLEGAAC
jgi:UDP-N-acetylmuramate dehydrogenase